ncbi:MAG TPA: FAD:protein FMN transferase, partial [Exilispira sp.]|nr:FAD:protein FMN transferase [Exilispira sp.]
DWRNSKSLLSNSDQKNDLIIPDEFKDFFSKIKYFNEFTEGYFNPFLRKLVIAYNNFEQGTTPPDDENIKLILQKIGKSKIYFDDKSNIIVKYPENLDLGAAIAGFLVDYSYKILIEKGYKNFLVNGSGEIRVSGSKFGKNWLIGIQDPFSNSIIDAIKMPDGYSISTSGSYERFFIYKGQKFHHILNPYSGKPDSKLESVSIVSKNSCLESDILSTAVFAMGIDRAIKFCEKNNVDYYLIYKEDEKIVIKHSKFFDK